MAISNPFAKRRDSTVLDWREHPGTTELIQRRRELQEQLRNLELATPSLELARITADGDLVEAEGRRLLGHIGDDELAAAKNAAEQARLAVSANGVQIADARAALEHLLQIADPVYRGAVEDVQNNIRPKHRELVERVDRAFAELLEANVALRQLEASVSQQDGSIERQYGPTADRPRLYVPASAINSTVTLSHNASYRFWRTTRFNAGALAETADERRQREQHERDGAERLREDDERRAEVARRAREFNR